MSYELFATDSFDDSVRKLKKRYRHIADDIAEATNELLKQPQIGDVIPGGFGIRKLRVANRDVQRGKSDGYRMLYYLIDEPRQMIFLLLVYSKSEREDVDRKELAQLLRDAGLR